MRPRQGSGASTFQAIILDNLGQLLIVLNRTVHDRDLYAIVTVLFQGFEQ